MTTQAAWFPGRLQVLSDAECMDLLKEQVVGRVAWNEPEGPIVMPVNYAIEGSSIIFRTAIDTKLARQLHLGFASFQIDEHDEYTQSGWSVLVRGVLSCVEARQPANEDWKVVPWAAGDRHFAMRITPLIITGRRIIPS